MSREAPADTQFSSISFPSLVLVLRGSSRMFRGQSATRAELWTLAGSWLTTKAAAKAKALLGRAPLLASRGTAGYAHQVSAAEAMDVAIYAPLTGMRTGAARGAAAVN